MRRSARIVCGLWVCTVACGGPPDAGPAGAAAAGGRPLLFTGARIIVGDGTVIDDGSLVVQDGVVHQAGKAADVRAPGDAVAIDVAGKTIMPAIVNAHSHLGWERYTSWGSENFTRENVIDHLNRHAYYGVGTVVSTASDKESIGLQIELDQRLGKDRRGEIRSGAWPGHAWRRREPELHRRPRLVGHG